MHLLRRCRSVVINNGEVFLTPLHLGKIKDSFIIDAQLHSVHGRSLHGECSLTLQEIPSYHASHCKVYC